MPEYRRAENGQCVASWRIWEGSGSTPAEALESLLAEIASHTREGGTAPPVSDQVEALSVAALKGMLTR